MWLNGVVHSILFPVVPLRMSESVSSSEDLQGGVVVSTVAELYGSLSYCAPPTSDTPTVARALTSSIVSITVRAQTEMGNFRGPSKKHF